MNATIFLDKLHRALLRHDYRTMTNLIRSFLREFFGRPARWMEGVRISPCRPSKNPIERLPRYVAAATMAGREIILPRHYWKILRSNPDYALFIVLHELGHVVAGRTAATQRYRTDPRARDASEFFAEFFALFLFHAAGRRWDHIPIHNKYLGSLGGLMRTLVEELKKKED